MKTNPELTQMLQSAKDSKTVITTIFHVFKKLSRVMEDMKITQIKFLKMTNYKCVK